MDHRGAEEYGKRWIEAWNAHDIESLCDHYSEDVVFRSPFIPRLTGSDECVIHGRQALNEYFAKGMEAFPHFRFQLHRVGLGVDSVVLNYIGVDGALASEVHVLDGEGRAKEVRCHYSTAL